MVANEEKKGSHLVDVILFVYIFFATAVLNVRFQINFDADAQETTVYFDNPGIYCLDCVDRGEGGPYDFLWAGVSRMKLEPGSTIWVENPNTDERAYIYLDRVLNEKMFGDGRLLVRISGMTFPQIETEYPMRLLVEFGESGSERLDIRSEYNQYDDIMSTKEVNDGQ